MIVECTKFLIKGRPINALVTTLSDFTENSKESSPTLQFKRINFLMLSLLFVQLLHPYMTTGKTTALTIWACVILVIDFVSLEVLLLDISPLWLWFFFLISLAFTTGILHSVAFTYWFLLTYGFYYLKAGTASCLCFLPFFEFRSALLFFSTDDFVIVQEKVAQSLKSEIRRSLH